MNDDEKRKKLCEALRRKARAGSWRVPMCEEAADEIERLAANQKDEYEPPLTETEQLVNILRHAENMYVGMNIRRQAADEIERLEKELAETKRYDMRDWHDAEMRRNFNNERT